MVSNLRHETSGSKKETASKTSSIKLQHHYTFFFFFFKSVFTMSSGCTASAIHQHSNIPEIKKGYEEIKEMVGKGKDRA